MADEPNGDTLKNALEMPLAKMLYDVWRANSSFNPDVEMPPTWEVLVTRSSSSTDANFELVRWVAVARTVLSLQKPVGCFPDVTLDKILTSLNLTTAWAQRILDIGDDARSSKLREIASLTSVSLENLAQAEADLVRWIQRQKIQYDHSETTQGTDRKPA